MKPIGAKSGVTAAVLLSLLAGCQAPRARQEEAPPFVFRSLDLKAQDGKGKPSWTLTAPEARYDLRRRLARAEAPRGLIFRAGQPLYRLQAASGTVLNDGEVILLEGAVRLERLGSQPLLLLAQRARWMTRQQRLLIDRLPRAYDRQGRLQASRAEFRFDQDQLSLQGRPRLDQWSQAFEPLRALPADPPAIRLEVPSASWQPGSGRLLAPGPVLGFGRAGLQRSASGRGAGGGAGAGRGAPLRLVAEGLEGDTLRRRFLLKGEVRVDDPGENQTFRGRDLRVSWDQRRASSDQPFRAQRGNLHLEGERLQVEATSQQLLVEGSCRITRPGEALQADRCTWNGQSEQLEASGGPGGRVVSRFRVPPPRR